MRGRLKILQPNHCCPSLRSRFHAGRHKTRRQKLLFLPEPRIVSQKACSGERTANRKEITKLSRYELTLFEKKKNGEINTYAHS